MFKQRQLILILLRHIAKAVIAAAVAIVVVTFFGTKIKTISNALQEQKLLTMVLEQRNATAATLREDFKQIGSNDQKIREAFLSTNDVLDFVGSLETIAAQNSMQETIKFGTPEPATTPANEFTVVPIGYTINANGTEATLVNYLKQLESLPYFAGITSITIASGSTVGWNDRSTITLQGKIYVHQNN